jgi:hypothetical protein
MNLHDYTKKHMDKSYTTVKQTRFKSGWRIKTQWLGYDSIAPSGRFLLIYVTYVVDPYDRHSVIQRWATEDDAQQGHSNWVARWKAEDRRKTVGLDERIPTLKGYND